MGAAGVGSGSGRWAGPRAHVGCGMEAWAGLGWAGHLGFGLDMKMEKERAAQPHNQPAQVPGRSIDMRACKPNAAIGKSLISLYV